MTVLRIPDDWKKDGLDGPEVIGRHPKPAVSTYEINVRDGNRSIICLRCKKESFHPEDVRQLYCSNCKIFHERKKF